MTDLAELKELLKGVNISICNSSWLGDHVRTALPELIEELDKARSGADELRAALEEIDSVDLGGPHVSAKAAFEAALAVIHKTRVIARTALAKHPSKSRAEE